MAGRPRVQDVIRFKDEGLSVEEARKQMLEAGEAPRGIRRRDEIRTGILARNAAAAVGAANPTETAIGEEFETEIPAAASPAPATVPAPAPAAVAPVVAPPIVEPPAPPKTERIETDQFVAEIRQENGKWVGEIKYKTGGGTERWITNTKNELMLELLKGKGNATLRVHQAVRREKLGSPDLDKQYPLPEGWTTEEFAKLKPEQQDSMLLQIAKEQVLMFRDEHSEFYRSDKNAKDLNDFLVKNRLPITKKNLEYAFMDLLADGLLETKPEMISVPTPAPVQTDSVPAPAAPTATPVAAIPAPAVPAVVVRKRGTTGLQPGISSSPDELERPEDGGKPRGPSEAELRSLPLPDLKRIVYKERLDRERRRADA